MQGAAWTARAQARSAIFDYIDLFYNPRRRQSSLGYLSPVAFERQWERQPAQAV